MSSSIDSCAREENSMRLITLRGRSLSLTFGTTRGSPDPAFHFQMGRNICNGTPQPRRFDDFRLSIKAHGAPSRQALLSSRHDCARFLTLGNPDTATIPNACMQSALAGSPGGKTALSGCRLVCCFAFRSCFFFRQRSARLEALYLMLEETGIRLCSEL